MGAAKLPGSNERVEHIRGQPKGKAARVNYLSNCKQL
jgi:hypothetical protein